MPDSQQGLMTAKEACNYLRISLFTLSRIEKQGLLVPYRTPGGHRRYSVEMLDAYLEQSRHFQKSNGQNNKPGAVSSK